MSSPPSSPKSQLEQTLANALGKRTQALTIRKLTTFPSTAADFSSNDFLSLATSAELRRDFLHELQSDPAIGHQLGSGGSRLLDGNSSYAETLERSIAEFHGSKTGLLCNSGFDANVGLFASLPQVNDVIVYDEYIHASVHDGMRMSRALQQIHFAHNSTDALRHVLEQCISRNQGISEGSTNVFVAVEAVYSMDGDMAPLREIAQLMKRLFPKGNGHLIVDEAHSTGVFGLRGRGLVCELGLEQDVTVRLHTFGKSMACNGAILLCSPLIREYLINYARPMIYTTFMSYPALAAIRASYNWLMTGRTEPLVANLHLLITTLHVRLLEMQTLLRLPQGQAHLLRSPETCPLTPIFAILSSEPKALAAHCQLHGFVVRGIVPPTVPEGTERIRVCLHASNTMEQIDGLVETIRTWVVKRARELEVAQDVRPRL